MNKKIKEEVAERLRHFLKIKFGSIAEAARQLQIPENTLRYSYLNAKSLPGFEALYQLLNKDCDLRWLLTGRKDYLDLNDTELRGRINNQVRILKNKFQIIEDKINYDNISIEISKGNLSDEIYANSIVYAWIKKESLGPVEFVNLARLTEASLSWLLCGAEGREKDFLEGFFLSYPEIELINKLKNYPFLFKKISAYLDSKLYGEDIDNFNT